MKNSLLWTQIHIYIYVCSACSRAELRQKDWKPLKWKLRYFLWGICPKGKEEKEKFTFLKKLYFCLHILFYYSM